MLSLFILNETFTNGFTYNILNVISLVSIICGISVIISKNPIVSVLFLIGLFLSIAAYLMMLGINFIGLAYLLVYVGAVSILFLFILMLINVRISELLTDNTNSIPLAIIINIIFSFTLYKLFPTNVKFNSHIYNLNVMDYFNELELHSKIGECNNIGHGFNNLFFNNNNELSFVTSQIWDGVLAEASHITAIGNIIYTAYPLWLIITSIILLLAMVGSIVITTNSNKDYSILDYLSWSGKPSVIANLPLQSGHGSGSGGALLAWLLWWIILLIFPDTVYGLPDMTPGVTPDLPPYNLLGGLINMILSLWSLISIITTARLHNLYLRGLIDQGPFYRSLSHTIIITVISITFRYFMS